MYFKENRQSMAEKDPPVGHADNFQTGPSSPPSLKLQYSPPEGGRIRKNKAELSTSENKLYGVPGPV